MNNAPYFEFGLIIYFKANILSIETSNYRMHEHLMYDT